jgi:hypothetical protein
MINCVPNPIFTEDSIINTFDNYKLSIKAGYGKSGMLRTISNVKKWSPLYPSNELAWLVGALIGDGTLLVRKHIVKQGKNAGKSVTYSYTDYYDQNPEIQQKFSNIVNSLFGITPELTHRDHSKNSYKFGDKEDNVFFIRNSAISRTLLCCGVPEGEKVLRPFTVPEWILNTEHASEIKASFLQGIMDAEGTVKRKYPYTISFEMWKSVKYRKNHLKFMEHIKNMFNEFGVLTGKLYERPPKIHRKDNIPTFGVALYIIRKKSILNFYRNINFSNPNKNNILERNVEVIKHGRM